MREPGSLERAGNVSASNLPNGKIRFLLYASSGTPDNRTRETEVFISVCLVWWYTLIFYLIFA